MIKKKILFIVISLLVSIVIIIVTHIISIAYYKSYGQYNEDAKRVYKLPERYILISELDNYYDTPNANLKYRILNDRIGFIDSDNMGIFSIPLNNSYFIVRYKGEYYINEWEYECLLHDANIIAEQRDRIYNLGDAIILRGSEIIPYVIIIDSVETENVGDGELNTIKFTTNPNIPEYERSGRKRDTPIFDHIETDKGTIIDDFTIIDEETVQVILPVDEKINIIVLKSPDYEDCIRKVKIEE